MKQAAAILVVLSAMVPALQGDQIVDERGIPYTGSVLGYDAESFELRLRQASGRQLKKPVTEIRQIQLDRNDTFTQAEAALADEQYDQAIGLYAQAARAARATWVKNLATVRQYQALSQSGQIDQAVSQWLKLARANNFTGPVMGLAPATFAPAGDPANQAAANALDQAIDPLMRDPVKNQATLKQLLTLKLKILEADGQGDQAAAVAETIVQLANPESMRPGQPTPADQPDRSASAQPATQGLAVLQTLYKNGKYQQLVDQLQGKIDDAPRAQRASRRLLLGKALQALGGSGESTDRNRLCQAGLNFVLIYVGYGDTEAAPEALYLAAEVNQSLGDTRGAVMALQELVGSYGGAGENPWVTKAQQQLQALQQQP
jgi:tetratricopeptide (TPR) repeat protein